MTTQTQKFNETVTFNFSQSYADNLMKTKSSENTHFKTTDTNFTNTP